MAERPLLVFPEPSEFDERHDLPGGWSDSELKRPRPKSRDSQVESRLTKLEEAFEERRVELQDSPVGIEPEKVLVLETANRVDFYTAVRRSNGLEWLLEWDEEFEPEEDGFRYEDDEKALRGRVYLVFSNQQGLEQMKSFWEKYKAYRENPDDVEFGWGKAGWRNVFDTLRDVRPWGPKDRLEETGLAEDWRRRKEAGETDVRVEIELWFRSSAERRQAASREVRRLVEEANGSISSESVITEIGYHALLGVLPIEEVEALLRTEESRLVRCDEVMLFRPTGQAAVRIPPEDVLETFGDVPVPELDGEPVAALLDGVPQQNHPLLQGRLTVDDPEGWESTTEVGERCHGTAMSSLAVWGNIDVPDPPLTRPLYVRPILAPDPNSWEDPPRERIPEDRLPVEMVYQAVTRLFESGTEESEAVAPEVKIIGLAVGDPHRPFSQTVSPWARLLDYLSYEYNILFIVSAGNQNGTLNYPVPREDHDELVEDGEKLTAHTVQAILNNARHRQVLSPSESINSLSVGAAHRDQAQPGMRDRWIDPLPNTDSMVSPISSVGFGYRRALKPDILYDGGRQVYRPTLGNAEPAVRLEPIVSTTRPPGIRAAYPSEDGSNEVGYFCGTSPAAAQTVGIAAKLVDRLESLELGAVGRNIDRRFYPALIKALLVHASDWGDASYQIQAAISEEDWRRRRRACERLLGYGTLDADKAFACTDQRATLLGWGSLSPESAHRYTLPLPPSLRGRDIPRRVRYTVAWFSPVHSGHQKYRRTHLYLSRYGEDIDSDEDPPVEKLLNVSRDQVGHYSARRGTVQHNVFEGDKPALFREDDVVELQVNCRRDAGGHDGPVRYGLIASLEVPEEANIPVYNEVRAAIRTRVGVEAR